MENIRSLQSWNNLRFSLLGRIAVIKMMVLLKLMFLFQTLLIINKTAILDKWQKFLTNFVWPRKKARIKMKALCDFKSNGGLQLPNLGLYFEAVALSLQEWVHLDNNRLLKLEGHDLAFGWHTYLIYEKWKIDRAFKNHSIRRILLQVWQKYKIEYNQKRPLWIIPLEVIKQKTDYNEQMKLRYKDLTFWKGNEIRLKEEKELKGDGGMNCR